MIQTILKVLAFFSKRDKKILAFFLGASLCLTFLEILTVSAFYPIINLSINSKKFESGITEKIYSFLNIHGENKIFVYTIIFVIFLYFFKNSLNVIYSWYSNKFINSIVRKVSVTLFREYINSPYSKLILKNSAEIIRNVQNSVAQIKVSIINQMIQLFSSMTIFLGFCVFFAYLDILLFLSITTIIILCFLLYRAITGKITVKYSQINLHNSKKINQSIIQAVQGYRETKLFNKGTIFANQYESVVKSTNKSETVISTISNSTNSFLESIFMVSILLMFLIAYKTSDNFEDHVVNLSLFALSMLKVFPSINKIFSAFPNMKYGRVHLDKIYNELSEFSQNIKIKSKTTTKKIEFNESITLKNAYFKYLENLKEYIIKDVSVTIKKNETIGIVGESGAGKTTLVDILIGLLTPQKGELLIDGKNIVHKESGWWSRIGYVPQLIHLIDGSVKENVAFGVQPNNIDSKKIRKCLQLANIYDDVQKFNDKENTIIGENGVKLSGGQRQRIGIARALYNNPDVLVFDEATSSLDNIAERAIMDAINFLSTENTIIIIAHRISTIQKCDKIIVMKKGKIESIGTYKEVSENSNTMKKILAALK